MDVVISGNIISINNHKINLNSEIESCVLQEKCVCVILASKEDNLICLGFDGKERWRGSDLYKKNIHAKRISQVAPNLLRVVWANGDTKVINSQKGEIYN